jgi:uncharacterized protein GlcG (DUF336 family)
MVDKAWVKAGEIGVSETVVILTMGAISRLLAGWTGSQSPTIEMAQNKAYTALFYISTQEFFNFIKGDSSVPRLPERT